MNKRTQRILLEMLLAIVMTILVGWGLQYAPDNIQLYLSGTMLLPLIWITLRHGGPTGVLSAAIAGLILGIIEWTVSDMMGVILYGILPLLSVVFSAFFAKYTQKTLNNRRLSSTYLNIYTATILVVLGYYLLKFVGVPIAFGQEGISLTHLNLWLGVAVSFILIGSILSLLANHQPSLMIPKRSKYLSRKETSSLLND